MSGTGAPMREKARSGRAVTVGLLAAAVVLAAGIAAVVIAILLVRSVLA